MGFAKSIYLYCDANFEGCDCQVHDSLGISNGFCEASSGDSPYTTVKEYKEEMKKQGWIFCKNNKAFCSSCKKKLKKEN